MVMVTCGGAKLEMKSKKPFLPTQICRSIYSTTCCSCPLYESINLSIKETDPILTETPEFVSREICGAQNRENTYSETSGRNINRPRPTSPEETHYIIYLCFFRYLHVHIKNNFTKMSDNMSHNKFLNILADFGVSGNFLQ